MKKIFLLSFILFSLTSFAQPKPKQKTTTTAPSQSEMDKMLQEAMKAEGMSKEEQEQMKNMMKTVMPALNEANEKAAAYPEFGDNKKLMPAKNMTKINSIPKKALTNIEIISNTTQLFSKLMSIGNKDERDIINKIVAKEKTADGLMAASITMFLQGHREAAIGLAMKTVLTKPDNLIYQNNLAATLTQGGLAQKAIPYLRKLLLQEPGNSTLNNNMGHAWFYLGEKDSAAKYISVALKRNPDYAEAKICRGILDELKGDPIKAKKEYSQSFEEIPNPLSDKLLQNQIAPNHIENTDYQKLISEVTIYEYFPKEWSQLPVLENTVDSYERNKGIAEGYKKMQQELSKKLKEMEKDANMQLDALFKKAEKNEDEFVKTMATENLQGLNMMSKPALYIIAILSNEQKRMMKENNDEYLNLLNFINEQQQIKSQVGSNAKCNVIDEKVNQYMQAVNPKVKEHWQKRLDEFRIWLNAWCTWRWYITGNIQNSVTAECLNWVGGFLNLHAAALRDFKIESPTCRKQGDITNTLVEKLYLPNFACPAIVEIPLNMNSIKLGAQSIEASHGNYGVSIKPGKMPNASISFGVDNSSITEPGLYGNPYIKTAEGSISQNGNTYADSNPEDELEPLVKIPPMNKIPSDKNVGEVSKADEIAIIKAKMTRLLLNQRLKTDCMKVVKGELELEEPTTMVMLPGTLEFNGEISTFDPVTGKWEKKPKGKIVVGIGELIFEEGPPVNKPLKSTMMKATLSNAVEMIQIPNYFSERELNTVIDNKK